MHYYVLGEVTAELAQYARTGGRLPAYHSVNKGEVLAIEEIPLGAQHHRIADSHSGASITRIWFSLRHG